MHDAAPQGSPPDALAAVTALVALAVDPKAAAARLDALRRAQDEIDAGQVAWRARETPSRGAGGGARRNRSCAGRDFSRAKAPRGTTA